MDANGLRIYEVRQTINLNICKRFMAYLVYTLLAPVFIMADYFIEENELIKQMFDLDEILAFQLENDVQIIRGEDYQYMCYINKSVYATGLTPMFALAYGVKVFKERS